MYLTIYYTHSGTIVHCVLTVFFSSENQIINAEFPKATRGANDYQSLFQYLKILQIMDGRRWQSETHY
jgi:hypothetical protein